MASNLTARIAFALAPALVGFALALLAGGTATAALLALVAGAISWALIVPPPPSATPAPAPPEPAVGELPLPGASELLETIDDPLLVVRNRRILLANAAARSVLGAHIEGADVRLAIRHPAAAEQLVDRAPASAEPAPSRIELVGLGDRDRRWEMTILPLAGAARLVRLTDRSAAHAAEQMRVDFVANASHELRTPLATLLGFLETLEDEDAANDPRTRSRFLSIMFDEAKRMQQLVEDLMSLSRIEAERFTLPRESVALLPLAEEVRGNCARLTEEKGAAIRVEQEASAPIVLGDRPQLLQLLHNLVVNALRYGKAGRDVVIRFEEAGPEMLRMSVVDQGEGIAPEHLPRLTERFYRVDPGRSRAVGGTGLGLAIVKHIVERHRGRLEIQSRLGEGTAVRVYLPMAPAVSQNSNDTVTETTRIRSSEDAGSD